MSNKDIIEFTIEEVLNDFAVVEEDFIKISDFILELTKVNINTFLTEGAENKLIESLTKDSTKQDLLLDFITAFIVKLSINNLDTDKIIQLTRNNIYNIVVSESLPVSLREQLMFNKDGVDDKVMNILFIIRIYGINILNNIIGDRNNGK